MADSKNSPYNIRFEAKYPNKEDVISLYSKVFFYQN
jgi:hypothetical protein